MSRTSSTGHTSEMFLDGFRAGIPQRALRIRPPSSRKLSEATNLYYSGRTSMVVDLGLPLDLQAEWAIRFRDMNHHVDENRDPRGASFDDAQLDVFDIGTAIDYNLRYDDPAYWRIRGREQQLMDFHGGAQSDTGKPHRTENVVRAVAKDNPRGRRFHDAATI